MTSERDQKKPVFAGNLASIFFFAALLSPAIAAADPDPVVEAVDPSIKTTLADPLYLSVPLLGRTTAALLAWSPTAIPILDGRGLSAGISLAGASGLENEMLLDGMSLKSPLHNALGAPVNLEFVRGVDIIEGGAGVELGEYGGGLLNVTTRSGQNELHGAAWFNYSPLQLDATPVGRVGAPIAIASKPSDYGFDFGAELSGALIKERLFFFAGIAPSFLTQSYDRTLRTRVPDAAQLQGSNNPGELDPSAACPSYLPKQLCPGGAYLTQDAGAAFARHYESQSNTESLFGRLDLRIDKTNTLSLVYSGSPSSFSGVFDDPWSASAPSGQLLSRAYGDPDGIAYTDDRQVHDVLLRWVGKFLDRRLVMEAHAGVHYESETITPTGADGNLPSVVDERPGSLARYEAATPCAPVTLSTGAAFDPCPVSQYQSGGFGLLRDVEELRLTAAASATYLAHFFGTHAIRLGAEVERDSVDDHRYYTGGAQYFVAPDGSVTRLQYSTPSSSSTSAPTLSPDGADLQTSELREALSLRDSYAVSFLPGLTIDAGVRWDLYQLFAADGTSAASITDAVAPRAGFAYDFTRRGHGRLFAGLGRYYGALPLDDADRFLPGATMSRAQASSCAFDSGGKLEPSTCAFSAPSSPSGSGYVSPVLHGPYEDELVAGLDYDVGLGFVLGASYIHRELGQAVEAISPDGVNTLLANPGTPADPGAVAAMQQQVRNLDSQIGATSDGNQLQLLTARRSAALQQLALYQAAASYPKPTRVYNALVITAKKRFGNNVQFVASYTYSRTVGNYDDSQGLGLPQSTNPDSAALPSQAMLSNRDGPLPTDRPHNFKLLGSYFLPLGDGGLTFGLAFLAISGAPIDVLGSRDSGDQVFILPRGSGGRTPTLTQLDLHIGYTRKVARDLRVDLTCDVFNLLDEQTPTSVDSEYTADNVLPIQNGTVADLAHLKNTAGEPVTVNPNYGQPTSYQQPLSMRFGARLAF